MQTINHADCLGYLDQRVFKLQPANYGRDFPKWPGLVGIEVEMLPLNCQLSSIKPQLIPLFNSPDSISEILLAATLQESGWTAEVQPLQAGRNPQLSRIALNHDDQITFEPGGQLEFSSSPYPCLSDATDRVMEIQECLDRLFNSQEARLLQLGINPWFTVEEIGLQMDKPRYQAMNEHFRRISSFGQRMMRQTCTVQVNLDFGVSDDVLVKRYLASQLVAPFVTAMFAYSPFVDNAITKFKSMRAKCWQELDGTRTGFPNLDGVFKFRSRESVVHAYLEHLLQAQVVFVESLDYQVPELGFSFGHWLEHGYKGVMPTLRDWQTHMSLHFPEVRARGFMELRSVDCQSRIWQFVPAAFYTGLLYDDDSLDQALHLLSPFRNHLMSLWSRCIYGLEDPEIRNTAQELGSIALAGFGRLPPCFRDRSGGEQFAKFLSRFTEQGRCPADDLIDQIQKDGFMNVQTVDGIEEQWCSLS